MVVNCGIASLGAPTRPSLAVVRIVEMRQQPDVDVHPLHRPLAWLVMAWLCPSLATAPGRPLQHRRAPIDRILGLAIEDDEHLLAIIVEVQADPAAWRQHAAMQEVEVDAEVELRGPALACRAVVPQRHIVHRPRTVVDGGMRGIGFELAVATMGYPLRKRHVRARKRAGGRVGIVAERHPHRLRQSPATEPRPTGLPRRSGSCRTLPNERRPAFRA